MKKKKLQQSGKIKVKRKERQSAVQISASVYFNSNYSSASCILRLHSNLLNKADFDEKHGLLFPLITSTSLKKFDCLHQFTGLSCGKLLNCLAQNIMVFQVWAPQTDEVTLLVQEIHLVLKS